MMESLECGMQRESRKGRSNSSEIECLSPASTSYGGFSPPPHGDGASTPSISDYRADREWKWKADNHGHPRRRSNASPGHWITSEKAETHDCGLCSSHGNSPRSEVKSSTSQKQARKKHKGRHSLASSVSLNQKFIAALPAEGGEESGGDDDDNHNDLSNSKTFERLVQRSELEEEVLLLQKRLEEEHELRVALESALRHAPGTLTSFPRHLPISAQELLADIAVLEVAVLKLEEQSTALRSELGQACTEREIAELRYASNQSMQLRLRGPLLHPTFVNSKETLEVYPPIGSPAKTPQTSQTPRTRAKDAATELTPHSSLRSLWHGQEEEARQPQNTWKEERARTLRQDLRLTIPEMLNDGPTSLSPWPVHQYGFIGDGQSRLVRSTWQPNPLEEEDHWIPLHEHHPQAMFASPDHDSPHDSPVDPCLLSVGLVTHEEDPPFFSPAIIAETLRPSSQSPSPAKQDDARSSLPIAEVLWKPDASPRKSLVYPEPPEEEVPRMALPSTNPESWSFTSEDDHPRPESGSGPHHITFEDPPWPTVAESPSVDEQRTKYRIGVMKVREQRRQGVRDKHSDKLKLMDSSGASSISSIKSGVPLSPIWSPVEDARSESDCWRSQESSDGEDGYESSHLFKSPNELSEQMVRTMINIYFHLADPSATASKRSSPSGGSVQSPTSPFAALTNSSASSLSESSLLSIARSPLVDLRSKEEVWGTDASPDPFKVRGKVPWADIGPYAHVFEVPWLSVGKDQLEYAAQALQNFKLLVEQLARVDPSVLKHEEKLAFWINLYNTLLMHAYLAYGIPRSDLKFFALLQKAAYTVGGHSFNAATMEYCLLKSKSTAHRPQLTLLAALHKNKLNEDESKYGIDHAEPLTNFALCSGTRSSPMVRVYTPKNVKSLLEDALHDYARATVGVSTKGRLLVPKLLYSYARDAVDDAGLADWICDLLPSNQVAAIFDVIQQQQRRRHHHRILASRNFTVVPFDFTFRYLFPSDAGHKKAF